MTKAFLHSSSPVGLEATDPDQLRTLVIEESLTAVERINRYLLQLLHEDHARKGLLTSLTGLSDASRQALLTLLDRPWAEVEAQVARLSSPLWRLTDHPGCWQRLATGCGDPQEMACVDGGLWPHSASAQ